MATATKRAIKTIEHNGSEVADTLLSAIASLRSEVASIAESVNDYGGHRFSDLQHGAVSLAKEVQHQLPVVARQVSRQANVVGNAVRKDPLPALVVLGTIALVSALIFKRD